MRYNLSTAASAIEDLINLSSGIISCEKKKESFLQHHPWSRPLIEGKKSEVFKSITSKDTSVHIGHIPHKVSDLKKPPTHRDGHPGIKASITALINV